MPPSTHTTDIRGFTLIELISSLVLVGILSAIAVSKIGLTASNVDLISEVEILKINLRYAQMRAMNSPYDDIWRVSFSSNGYTLQQYDSASTTWQDRGLPSETADTDSDGIYETRPFAASVSKSSGPTAVRFDSWGIPVQSDRITPETGNLVITLSDGTNSRSLTVTRNTGYIP